MSIPFPNFYNVKQGLIQSIGLKNTDESFISDLKYNNHKRIGICVCAILDKFGFIPNMLYNTTHSSEVFIDVDSSAPHKGEFKCDVLISIYNIDNNNHDNLIDVLYVNVYLKDNFSNIIFEFDNPNKIKKITSLKEREKNNKGRGTAWM